MSTPDVSKIPGLVQGQQNSNWDPVVAGFATYAAISYLDRNKDPNRPSERIAKVLGTILLAGFGIFVVSILVMVLFGIGV